MARLSESVHGSESSIFWTTIADYSIQMSYFTLSIFSTVVVSMHVRMGSGTETVATRTLA